MVLNYLNVEGWLISYFSEGFENISVSESRQFDSLLIEKYLISLH